MTQGNIYTIADAAADAAKAAVYGTAFEAEGWAGHEEAKAAANAAADAAYEAVLGALRP